MGNFDLEKLNLGKAKKVVKKKEDTSSTDEAVKLIHETESEEEAKPKRRKKKKEPTKRVTLDIPISLHKEIRKGTFDMGVTMKDYFLDLARKDMGL
jgi:hypothetical protein